MSEIENKSPDNGKLTGLKPSASDANRSEQVAFHSGHLLPGIDFSQH